MGGNGKSPKVATSTGHASRELASFSFLLLPNNSLRKFRQTRVKAACSDDVKKLHDMMMCDETVCYEFTSRCL